jgi:hypothetical protein
MAAWAQTVTFAETPPGTLPKGFVSALTGRGKPGRWEIGEDKAMNSTILHGLVFDGLGHQSGGWQGGLRHRDDERQVSSAPALKRWPRGQ